MQFHIPQHLEIEDKLFGPLTLKQAIYVAGGAGGAYLLWRIIPWTPVALPFVFAVLALTWALAFYPEEKMGRPFIDILQAGLSYAFKNKLYTWKKVAKEREVGEEEAFIPSQPPAIPSAPTGTLSSKSFTLDTKNPLLGEEEPPRR